MMQQTECPLSPFMSPAFLLKLAGFVMIITLLISGCSPQPEVPPQPGPSGAGTTAPDVTELPPLAPATLTDTVPPRPSTAPTSTPAPTDTPMPTLTTAPSSTPQPATRPTLLPTNTSAPTQPPAPTSPPASNMVTFQITNATDKIIYVYGYGMVKSIPSGLTVYFQAPDWGEISLRICHKNKLDEIGGCYNDTGTISISNPVITITK
jgi:hypothetical protein